MSQVREDAKFLHAAEVIDYSMLLGIHMVSRRHKEVEHLTPLQGGAATPSNVTNAATPRALPQVNGVAGMAASGVGSGHEAGLTNGSGNVLPLRMLLKHDSINSNDGDDPGKCYMQGSISIWKVICLHKHTLFPIVCCAHHNPLVYGSKTARPPPCAMQCTPPITNDNMSSVTLPVCSQKPAACK